MSDLDARDIISKTWSIDGPHTTDSIYAAADAIAELWRYLGHATFARYTDLEPYHLYDILGALKPADERSVDVLNRLSDRAAQIASNATEYGKDWAQYGDDVDTSHLVTPAMTDVADDIRAAAMNHRAAATTLGTAQSATDGVYRKDDES